MARTRAASPLDVDQAMALIDKGQQLAGHFPDERDLERARRVLTGEVSPEAARAEVRDELRALAARGKRTSA